jgi:hypothetical protein
MMKYVSNISRSFTKYARLFEELTTEQQKEYLSQRPHSWKQLIAQGQEIAEKLGLIFNGYWDDAHSFLFTDPQTESSLMAKNFEHTKLKLQQSRKRYEEAEAAVKFQAQITAECF